MRPFTTLAVAVFVLVAIVHLVRIMFGWEVTVGARAIPMWLSGIGFVASSLLAGLVWSEAQRSASKQVTTGGVVIPEPPDREKYALAIGLIEKQFQIFWLVFGAFLLAETVLLGGLISVANTRSKPLIFGGSLLGLFLAVPWWTSLKYHNALYTLRIMQARAHEPVCGTFFTEGQCLIDGQPVREVKMPWIARVLRPRRAEAVLIIVFALAFLFLALFARTTGQGDDLPSESAHHQG